jgi:hypothetical protein
MYISAKKISYVWQKKSRAGSGSKTTSRSGSGSDCSKSSLAKYNKPSRKAPAMPAKNCQGQTKKGKDGMYKSVPRGNSYAWQKVKSTPKSKTTTRKKSKGVSKTIKFGNVIKQALKVYNDESWLKNFNDDPLEFSKAIFKYLAKAYLKMPKRHWADVDFHIESIGSWCQEGWEEDNENSDRFIPSTYGSKKCGGVPYTNPTVMDVWKAIQLLEPEIRKYFPKP